MDGEHFDSLVKRLTQTRLSRSAAVRGVLASAVVGLTGATRTDATPPRSPDARKAKKKKKKNLTSGAARRASSGHARRFFFLVGVAATTTRLQEGPPVLLRPM